LLDILQYGPVAVTMSAAAKTFEEYTTGIYDERCHSAVVDHAMAVVGVDVWFGYWILRNSWGSAWGEKGYIRISFESARGCGMLSHPVGVSLYANP
jgi:C1A family cysteine protease